jgi:cell division protease FtsH
MLKKISRNFKRNRTALAVSLALGATIFIWMVYGAGQRATGYAQQFDIKAPLEPYRGFVDSLHGGKYEGATIYIRGDNGALVVGPLGPSVIVPDFVDSVSQKDLRELRAHNIDLQGEVAIQSKPALPSSAQAAAAAFTDTVGRFGSAILSIALTGFMLLYLRTSLTAAGGIFKKKYRTYDTSTGDSLPVRLADVAGMDGPKRELAEVVEYLREPKRFADLGARAPRGVLLYGPPGNGKTLLAKAVAGEAGVPFLEQNASSFVQMFVGAGAAAARDLFKEARRMAKERGGCVVFIDEIDAVGGRRDLGGHDERMQTLNGLLAEMDGFADNTGVVVIAATNRLESLDQALLRPGRFDRKVYVPLPGVKARAEILTVHLKRLKRTNGINTESLAQMAAGMSGADLANWVNEAAIEAARRKDPAVTMEHFALARDRVLIGPRNFGIELTEDEERATAFHEAGHALVRLALGGKVDRVTIVPHGAAMGVTFSVPSENNRFTRESLATELAVLMGGRAAEEIFTGTVSAGASSDIERASRMAFEACTLFGLGDGVAFTPQTEAGRTKAEDAAREMVNAAYARAKSILEHNRGRVKNLAERLVAEKTVAIAGTPLEDLLTEGSEVSDANA